MDENGKFTGVFKIVGKIKKYKETRGFYAKPVFDKINISFGVIN